MKRIFWATFLLFPITVFGDGSSGIHTAPLNIRTIDGAVNGYPYSLIFQNGCLQNNNNGTFTIICGSSGTVTTAAFLLTEDGDYFSLQTGGRLVLE